MEQKDIGIICQVVYKSVKEKSPIVDFTEVKNDATALINLINELSAKTSVPFASAPTGSPRGTKVAGMLCPTCNTPMIQGKKGVYCKPCFVKWAEANKK